MLFFDSVEIFDGNGKKVSSGSSIFHHFSGNVTPITICNFADEIANYHTIIAKTRRVCYRSNETNIEYESIQQIIRNGRDICSKLGVTFLVREEQLHYRNSLGWHFLKS